jgi:GH18 family chitinase
MSKYVILVKKDNGVNLLVTANDKMEAITKFKNEYPILFSYNFEVINIDWEFK